MADKPPPKATEVKVTTEVNMEKRNVPQEVYVAQTVSRSDTPPPNNQNLVSASTASPSRAPHSTQEASSLEDISLLASSAPHDTNLKEWEKELTKTESELYKLKTLTPEEELDYKEELEETESEITMLKKLVDKKKKKKKQLEHKLGITGWKKFQSKVEDKNAAISEKVEEEYDKIKTNMKDVGEHIKHSFKGHKKDDDDDDEKSEKPDKTDKADNPDKNH